MQAVSECVYSSSRPPITQAKPPCIPTNKYTELLPKNNQNIKSHNTKYPLNERKSTICKEQRRGLATIGEEHAVYAAGSTRTHRVAARGERSGLTGAKNSETELRRGIEATGQRPTHDGPESQTCRLMQLRLLAFAPRLQGQTRSFVYVLTSGERLSMDRVATYEEISFCFEYIFA